jgi:hypothetical protein
MDEHEHEMEDVTVSPKVKIRNEWMEEYKGGGRKAKKAVDDIIESSGEARIGEDSWENTGRNRGRAGTRSSTSPRDTANLMAGIQAGAQCLMNQRVKCLGNIIEIMRDSKKNETDNIRGTRQHQYGARWVPNTGCRLGGNSYE